MIRARRPQTAEPDPPEPVFEWVPYTPIGSALRITHTSCCGRYEFACEGGRFFVLRPVAGGSYEETGRGLYRHALTIYTALVEHHRAEHRHRVRRPGSDVAPPEAQST
ncbi:hypothetical protein GCM10009733_092250 [Nonomuraea maheshkhaliensis]|uniref:Uncharacterized protein n=1 Tax=Nonomuraea maheshkhaliensis TaxID=419590 RepID=A0ABP4T2Q7_9ACTN